MIILKTKIVCVRIRAPKRARVYAMLQHYAMIRLSRPYDTAMCHNGGIVRPCTKKQTSFNRDSNVDNNKRRREDSDSNVDNNNRRREDSDSNVDYNRREKSNSDRRDS